MVGSFGFETKSRLLIRTERPYHPSKLIRNKASDPITSEPLFPTATTRFRSSSNFFLIFIADGPNDADQTTQHWRLRQL